MKEIIEKAIEGGWTPNGSILLDTRLSMWIPELVLENYYHQPTFLLFPAFWQALGKALGWEYETPGRVFGVSRWLDEWHRFINHLASGQPAESFFEALLAKEK